MKIYLITDTHFNHDRMIEYCNRPKNFEEMIWSGLRIINPNDLLIHLGDVCIGNDKETHLKLMGRVQCKKILIRGNHDRKSNNWYLENGWDFVCKTFSDIYFGKKILFSHEPHEDIGFDINIHGHFHNTLYRLKRGEYVIEGEQDRNETNLAVLTDKHKLLALEYTDYKPVDLEKFLK